MMTDQNMEKKYIKCYYWAWIIIVAAAFLGEMCGLFLGFHADFLYMLFGLYVPAIGLWALHEKYDWSYAFLGVSLCCTLVVFSKVIIWVAGGH